MWPRRVSRAIISDHGGDLAGGIELFRKGHPRALDLYDITHKAACLLKARLGRDEQWGTFAAQAGQTKCRIQQTEWSFLVPPSPRLKARYMNLGELIGWGKKTLAILDDPGPEVLRHGSAERLNEKLGWLVPYREGLVRWSELEQVIDVPPYGTISSARNRPRCEPFGRCGGSFLCSNPRSGNRR